MLLREHLTTSSIAFDIEAANREAALDAAIALLSLPERAHTTVSRLLLRRELVGTTAVGHAIAIPHCRTLAVSRLRMAYVRLATPIDWQAPDDVPVRHVFLMIAPPVEVGNQYLQALGRLARLAREPEALALLDRLGEPAEFTGLLERFGD